MFENITIVRDIDKSILELVTKTYEDDSWDDSVFTYIDSGEYGDIYKYDNYAVKIGCYDDYDNSINLEYGRNRDRINVEDGSILYKLQHLDYFPIVYAFSDEWVIMEFIYGTLLEDIDDKDELEYYLIELLDIFTQLFKKGIYLNDLHLSNVMLTNGRLILIDADQVEFTADCLNFQLVYRELDEYFNDYLKIHF